MQNTYEPHHPWYYKLGGKSLYPKQIIKEVKSSGYRGYMQDDISKIDNKCEPQRSEHLKKVRAKVVEDLKNNLSIYRKCIRDLRKEREQGIANQDRYFCSDINMSMSLKHNHLYNNFAHLIYLDELIIHQLDLFAA